jgi:LacI family transcriptional regulator
MIPTMKDIQKSTGLGLATISKYINGGAVRPANKLLLDKAVVDLGYQRNEYARALKTSRSKTVGVLIPELSSLFCTTIITSVEDALRKKGYAVIVCDCRSDEGLEKKAVEFLLSKKVDGILNIPVSMDGRHLKEAASAGVPVVLVDRRVEAKGFDAVIIDNRNAAKEAVEHLAARGHRRIGFICGSDGVYTFRERRLGYRDALADSGIAYSAEMDCAVPTTISGGYEAMKRLLVEAPGMSAVFVTNYEMTLGAVIAANEAGVKIPGSLSFIGFDNLELSKVMTPRLTTVAQQWRKSHRPRARGCWRRWRTAAEKNAQ